MKKCLKVAIGMFITVSFILAGCAKDNSIEDSSGLGDSYFYGVKGWVMEIVGENTVLISVLERNRDFQAGDIVAVKYDVSWESVYGIDNIENFEAKPIEVQIGDIAQVYYFKHEKRDIGEIKDCNYISPIGGEINIIPKERYESMHSEDADES